MAEDRRRGGGVLPGEGEGAPGGPLFEPDDDFDDDASGSETPDELAARRRAGASEDEEGEGEGESEPRAVSREEFDRLQQQYENLNAVYGRQTEELGTLRSELASRRPARTSQNAGLYPDPSEVTVGYGEGPGGGAGGGGAPVDPELERAWNSAIQSGDFRPYFAAQARSTMRIVAGAAQYLTEQARTRAESERAFYEEKPGFEQGQARELFQTYLTAVEVDPRTKGLDRQEQMRIAGERAEKFLEGINAEIVEEDDAATREARRTSSPARPRGSRRAGAQTPRTQAQIVNELGAYLRDSRAKRRALTRGMGTPT